MPGLWSRLRPARLSVRMQQNVNGLLVWLSMSRTASYNIQSLIFLLPTLFSVTKALLRRPVVRHCSGRSMATWYWRCHYLWITIHINFQFFRRLFSPEVVISSFSPKSATSQLNWMKSNHSNVPTVCIMNRVCMDNIVFWLSSKSNEALIWVHISRTHGPTDALHSASAQVSIGSGWQ